MKAPTAGLQCEGSSTNRLSTSKHLPVTYLDLSFFLLSPELLRESMPNDLVSSRQQFDRLGFDSRKIGCQCSPLLAPSEQHRDEIWDGIKGFPGESIRRSLEFTMITTPNDIRRRDPAIETLHYPGTVGHPSIYKAVTPAADRFKTSLDIRCRLYTAFLSAAYRSKQKAAA